MEDIFNRIVEEGKLSDEFRLLSERKEGISEHTFWEKLHEVNP